MSASGQSGSTTQIITPYKWTLAGTVPPDLASKVNRTLVLLRPSDFLSPQIKSTFTARSVVPMIVISTSKGQIILTNAKVSSFGPPDRTHKPITLQNSEAIQFVFQQITVTWTDGGKTASDDWLTP